MKPQLATVDAIDRHISKSDVEDLMKHGEANPAEPVLSLYLDTDQSNAINLNQGYEVLFKNMIRKVELSDDKLKREFQHDLERVRQFLKDRREISRAVVIFSDASEDFFWVRQLAVNVRNTLRWRVKPDVQPLLELIDEHERYGVVLTDREKGRLLVVFLGQIEEYREAFAAADVKHIKSSGTDHLRSQMHIQRKADLHARWHLKEVAEAMSLIASSQKIDRLILGGTVEATSELYDLLPKALQVRVVSRLSIPVEANTAQVLDETLKIEKEIERQFEVDLVEALITAGMKKQKAVVGLDETLIALQQGRIWQLVYTDGFEVAGGQCTNCGSLVTKSIEPCVYCGKPVEALEDLIQVAVDRVIDQERKIEQVRGPARLRLNEVGGVGAILHY